MKARLIIGGASVLMLFALPALADPVEQVSDLRAAIFAPADGANAIPAAKKPGGPGGVSSTSTCTALCQDGSSRTCTGNSCNAVNWSCPNQSGYCWSDLEGTKSCPVPTCSQTCTASCAGAGGGSVSCTTSSGNIFCIDSCYAQCDHQYYFCPSPAYWCPW